MRDRKTIELNIPETAAERVALADSRRFPKCWGVSRVAGNEKAVLVSFDEPLSDDQLSGLHELISKNKKLYS